MICSFCCKELEQVAPLVFEHKDSDEPIRFIVVVGRLVPDPCNRVTQEAIGRHLAERFSSDRLR
jgi:hypothetical protein